MSCSMQNDNKLNIIYISYRYTKKYLRRYFPVRRLTCIPGYEGENCATRKSDEEHTVCYLL